MARPDFVWVKLAPHSPAPIPLPEAGEWRQGKKSNRRAATQTIEETLHKAMPLGSVANYAYKQETVTLAASDVVVLMSDGLPERFNEANEMLGYEQMQTILARTATLPAADIIQQFVQRGDDGADGKPQDDDVTFVVLKVREPSRLIPESRFLFPKRFSQCKNAALLSGSGVRNQASGFAI